MLKTFLFLLVLLTNIICYGQRIYDSEIYHHQIAIQHDNDFFTLTDRYYSSGLFLTLRKSLKKGVFGKDEQVDFRIGQEVYTPSQTQSTNSNLFDRPYVGFTGISTLWSKAKNSSLIQFETLFGIAGNNSGAGGFQCWYHKAIAISDSPLWIDELNNSFHANLYLTYTKEWKLVPNPFGILIALQPQIGVGSRDIFGETEAIFHFGRRNTIGKSIAYNRLGDNQREIYFALSFSYRQVLYNGLIQGNLFGDNSLVTKEIESSLFRIGFDFNHRFDQNDYKVGVRYNTGETPDSKSHIYLQLSYAFGW